MFLTSTIWWLFVAPTSGGELAIFENDSNKMQHRVEEKNLFTFEKTLRKQIVRADPSDEVFAFATSGSFDFILDLLDKPVTPKELMVITVRGKTAEFQWSSDRGKTQFRRKLAEDEVDSIRKFVKNERVDQLPVLSGTRIVDGKEENVVGGTIHVYLHLTKQSGRRVLINNPPTRGEDKFPPDEPVWKYTDIVEFFNALKPPEKAATP